MIYMTPIYKRLLLDLLVKKAEACTAQEGMATMSLCIDIAEAYNRRPADVARDAAAYEEELEREWEDYKGIDDHEFEMQSEAYKQGRL